MQHAGCTLQHVISADIENTLNTPMKELDIVY